MGYSHYFDRPKVLPKAAFAAIRQDFAKLLPELERIGLKLAGPLGKGPVEVGDDGIWFNGAHDCGHLSNQDLVIPWPSAKAGGIAKYNENAIDGTWFAGASVEKRCCNGDCSYESFCFPVRLKKGEDYYRDPQAKDRGLVFQFCKTAFRPYDLAVICFLIIAKRHLKTKLRVASDGEDGHWADGRLFCQMHLGYGEEYHLVVKSKKAGQTLEAVEQPETAELKK
ncbi:MAG: hypothetical protein ABFE07_28090 [Armatimonadia bacterium]